MSSSISPTLLSPPMAPDIFSLMDQHVFSLQSFLKKVCD